MKSLGEIIRRYRENKGLTLQEVAAFLNIDRAVLSKIERGLRRISREQIIKLATFFKVDENELLVAWLSDKIVFELQDADLALEAIHLAEEKIEYCTATKETRTSIINTIKQLLKKDARINEAWIYGSFARNQDKYESDIDLMVSFNENSKVSLHDLADLAHRIERKIHRRIDLVEKGLMKSFAWETARNDLIKIYG